MPLLAFTLSAGAAACSDTTETAYLYDVPLITMPLQTFETDLGYHVVLTRVDLALEAQYFTRFGEAHLTSRRLPLLDWAFSTAVAHPGHNQGGDITGEASTRVVASFGTDANTPPFATVNLAKGHYDAVDFVFGRLPDSPDVSILLEGTATAAGASSDDEIAFSVRIRQDVDRYVSGVPFDVQFDNAQSIRLHFDGQTRYDVDGKRPTIFDTIDFDGLIGDASGTLILDADSHRSDANKIRNNLQKHDFYYYDLLP